MHKIYQIDPKNYQKLTRKKYILSIAHRKSFESELQFERHFPSKPNHISQLYVTSSEMFSFVSIVHIKIAKATQIFTTASMYDIMRH